jgi:hypothetical protein
MHSAYRGNLIAMGEFVLLSPLPDWRGGNQEIAEGIRIRSLTTPERSALDGAADSLLRHHDVAEAAWDAWWVAYEFDNPHPPDNVRHRRRQDAAFKLMTHAQYAMQILAPVGAPNVCLLYRKTADGLALETTQQRPAYLPSIWARMAHAPVDFAAHIPALLSQVREVFQRPILRLQIPIWLLEQGLGAPDRHIRILLWATGLDGLTRSGGVVHFGERVCDLIGADSYVFPPADGHCRPELRVKDVAQDLYQLRTEMAHGLPFHVKFRQTRGLSAEFPDWRYDHVLEECAVFLLCDALRQTLLNGPDSIAS